ncbi:glutamate decarboxylase [Leucosporidium creatinivorum]|uniref:Glutamate decarboxylase n=1 Tax=Leucosporidium creatinivorum TaxID=106004 RepID=A0A1Y2FYF5_9BASI|nr:glutamate decarboxylase [Leucosporidium creatinivorum]
MTLSRQINAEKVLAASHEHAKRTGRTSALHLLEKEHKTEENSHPDYGTTELPKYKIPHDGTTADIAYELIHNELSLDGTPVLNLASFVHTHMTPQADKLMMENLSKNLIDSDEYPATTLIHTRTVSMLASLWHADDKERGTGTATTGSSEAIQLAGLAMKKRWQERMRAAGKDEYRPGPNIIMGANAQVALEKFARYFDVEMRLVPVDESTNYVMSPERAMQYVDENTIGVFVILGSTYTGAYEDVKGMCEKLDEYEAKTGTSIPVHVDGASGAFVAPFATPKLVWDFRLPRVVSINTSGHKFGQAYVGVGFVVWRDSAHLPKDLVFELHYLGSVEYSFSLNFSRPAHPIIGMYYNMLKLGFDGYRKVSLNNAKNARLLARALENSKYYTVVSDLHKPVASSLTAKATHAVGLSDDIEHYTPSLPVVAFKFSDEFKKEFPSIKQRSIQTLLRAKNWIVPNYELPPNVENVEILRVVVREQFSEELVERLVFDIVEVTEDLIKEAKSKIPAHEREPEHGDNQKAHEKISNGHGKGERQASKHGEGIRPTGHDSVC